MSQVTLILDSLSQNDEGAMEKLLPLVYQELREMAAGLMTREAAGHTLQPTALVHEMWLRLVSDSERIGKSRPYFFAAASEAMRRILVEHARRKSRLKHGGKQERLNVEELELAEPGPDEKILLINDALKRMEAEQPERAQIVVMKYFGGMTNKEVAETLGISERTVDRHWICAKTWLFNRICEQEQP